MEVFCTHCGQHLFTLKADKDIWRVIIIFTCPTCKELCDYRLELKGT